MDSSTTVPAGGPSTINGVLYQLLWSLLSAGRMQAIASQVEREALESVTLVLEPSQGGDLQTIASGNRVVTQIKARSDQGTWSLQELVCDVLPDLYRAVDLARPNTEFQFVTEGRLGNWGQILELFSKLPDDQGEQPCFDDIDDITVVPFRARRSKTENGFWGNGQYTLRSLLRKIVDTLRNRKTVEAEPFEDTCRKLRHLLRRFRFLGGNTHAGLSKELDQWLLARLGSIDLLEQKRDHLLLELGRQACTGDARIEPARFFKELGLADTPLSEWVRLSKKSKDYLAGVLRRRRANVSEDFRPRLTDRVIAASEQLQSITFLSGESGSGKTWHGLCALMRAAENGDVVLVVDAKGNADRDIDQAAKVFWHDIVGCDQPVPFSRLRSRLTQLDSPISKTGLAILFDNVTSLEEAYSLAGHDWEGWGIRVIMTGPRSVAQAAVLQSKHRFNEILVEDYSRTELHQFLDAAAVAWEDVPHEIRNVLRRPFLAKLFVELVDGSQWRPNNEYDLCSRAWQRAVDLARIIHEPVEFFGPRGVQVVARPRLALQPRGRLPCYTPTGS